MVQDQNSAAWQSFAALAATMLFTSLRHVYRFGASALLFNALTIIVAALLLWQRRKGSAVASVLYGLVAAWIVTGFGIVDALWDGVLRLYIRYFFPDVAVFRRSVPRPFGFEAAAILTAAASLFALFYTWRYLRTQNVRVRPWLIAVPAVVVLAGTAYGIATRTDRNARDVTRIGVMVPLHGPQQSLGLAFARAVELAKAERKTRRRYEIVVVDSGTTPQEARAAIEKLIYQENVQAIVGGISRSGQIAAPFATYERIPHFCVCSVASIGDGVYNFTNIPLPEDESRRWVEEAKLRGIRRIAIIAQKYPSIDGHVNALVSEAERNAMAVVFVHRFDANTTVFRSIIEAARLEEPDVIVVSGFNPALDKLGADLRAAGVRSISAIVALALSENKALFDGAWYTDSFIDRSLRKRFEARFPDTPFVGHMVPYAYDSYNILIDGFERSADMRTYLGNVTSYRGVVGLSVRDPGTGNFRSRPAVWTVANGSVRMEKE